MKISLSFWIVRLNMLQTMFYQRPLFFLSLKQPNSQGHSIPLLAGNLRPGKHIHDSFHLGAWSIAHFECKVADEYRERGLTSKTGVSHEYFCNK